MVAMLTSKELDLVSNMTRNVSSREIYPETPLYLFLKSSMSLVGLNWPAPLAVSEQAVRGLSMKVSVTIFHREKLIQNSVPTLSRETT